MDYLFFDIECANCDGGNGKICSFGYVLTDDKFNIKEYTDLIINPKARFKLNGYGKKTYITLAYSEETFLSSPDFTYYYEKIAELLKREDRIVFGYAPENDADFIRSEVERYNLPKIDFTFYDVQRLFRAECGYENGNLCSLSSACEMLGAEVEFTSHKSCDDAFATMKVLEAICKVKNTTPSSLVEKHDGIRGELKNGDVVAAYFKQKTELKPGEENYIKGINKDDFKYLLRRLSDVRNKGVLNRKRICISWLYEYKHFKEMLWLVKSISDNGGRYTHKVAECDVFVKKPRFVRGLCKRESEAVRIKELSGGKRPIIIDFDEFLRWLETDIKELERNCQNSLKIIEELRA